MANNVSIAAQSFVGDEASSNTADVWLTEEITLCANLVYDGVIYEPTEVEYQIQSSGEEFFETPRVELSAFGKCYHVGFDHLRNVLDYFNRSE